MSEHRRTKVGATLKLIQDFEEDTEKGPEELETEAWHLANQQWEVFKWEKAKGREEEQRAGDAATSGEDRSAAEVISRRPCLLEHLVQSVEAERDEFLAQKTRRGCGYSKLACKAEAMSSGKAKSATVYLSAAATRRRCSRRWKVA